MKVTLAPIKHRDAYSAAIEKKINEYFREAIYGPLLAVLEAYGVTPKKKDQGSQGNLNARFDAVAQGLDDGQIWYSNGTFSGNFNAEISKQLRGLGATWDKSNRVFNLPQSKLPPDLVFPVASSVEASAQMHRDIESMLGEMQGNIAISKLGLKLGPDLDRILIDLTKQFLVTTSKLDPDNIAITPEITPSMSKEIDAAFTDNLDLYIKDFTAKQIPELRKRVAANAYEGGRADKLAKIIEADYGVSKRKAAFLAEQETALLVSKFRESRYKSIGAESYKWSTSNDERVRADHRKLEGKQFFWASPPVTNLKTGARNNPGEDFRCRCVALPVLEIDQ